MKKRRLLHIEREPTETYRAFMELLRLRIVERDHRARPIDEDPSVELIAEPRPELGRALACDLSLRDRRDRSFEALGSERFRQAAIGIGQDDGYTS